MATDPLIGKVVARCRLEERVGGGTTAVVYRGEHTGLGVPVAVKILRPKAAANETVVDAFRKEARTIARLDNENVLKVYDVLDDGKLHCMVMELLEGDSVLDLVAERTRLSRMDALRVLRQAALGLAAVHAKGIVHRDVKPENLVIMPDGTVKLVDFGLAFEGEGEGKRVGTPHYVSPETAATGRTEPASDVYSLGVTLFHLLVGQPPYAGRSLQEVLRAHLGGAPMNLEEQRPKLGRDVVALFKRMVAQDPEERPTAEEIVETVDDLGGKSLQRKSSLTRRGGRGRTGLIIAAVVAGLLLAGLAFHFRSQQREAAKRESEARARAEAEAQADRARANRVKPAPVPIEVDPAVVAERERMAKEAQELLDGVETWARANWSSREDNGEVVRRYEQISGPYDKTPAAEEARRRVEEIAAGRLHPHPDRSWSPPEEVEAARKALEERRAEVQQLVAEGRYADAKEALPAPLSDPSGALEAEVGFQHTLLDRLAAFPSALFRSLEANPNASRSLKTGRGEGEVEALDDDGVSLRIDDEPVTLGWKEIEPKAIVRLALRVSDTAPAADRIPLLAFCFARGLDDAFWQASMGLNAAAVGDDEAFLRELEKRLKAR